MVWGHEYTQTYGFRSQVVWQTTGTATSALQTNVNTPPSLNLVAKPTVGNYDLTDEFFGTATVQWHPTAPIITFTWAKGAGW
jgi:hypothetical protein